MTSRLWRMVVVVLLAAIWLQLGGSRTVADGWRAFSRWSGLAGKEETKPFTGDGLADAFYEQNLRMATEEAARQAASAASR